MTAKGGSNGAGGRGSANGMVLVASGFVGFKNAFQATETYWITAFIMLAFAAVILT
jgi:hypothetical protein